MKLRPNGGSTDPTGHSPGLHPGRRCVHIQMGLEKGLRDVTSKRAEEQRCGRSFCEVVEIISMGSRKTQVGLGGSSEKGQECKPGAKSGPRLRTFPSAALIQTWRLQEVRRLRLCQERGH